MRTRLYRYDKALGRLVFEGGTVTTSGALLITSRPAAGSDEGPDEMRGLHDGMGPIFWMPPGDA